MNFPTGEAAVTRSVTKTPRDKEARVGWMRRRRRGERDEWCQGRRIGRDETGFALLITRRSQVQILPPLPTCQRYHRRSTARKLSLRAVFVSGGGVSLACGPFSCPGEVCVLTRSLTRGVSGVPQRLRLVETRRDD